MRDVSDSRSLILESVLMAVLHGFREAVLIHRTKTELRYSVGSTPTFKTIVSLTFSRLHGSESFVKSQSVELRLRTTAKLSS